MNMTTKVNETPNPHRAKRVLKGLWGGTKVLLLVMALLALAGGIGWVGVEFSGSIEAWQAWLYQSRFGFLAWRILVYGSVIGMLVQLFRRCRKTRPAALPMLCRMACLAVVMMLLGEYSIHLQWEVYTR